MGTDRSIAPTTGIHMRSFPGLRSSKTEHIRRDEINITPSSHIIIENQVGVGGMLSTCIESSKLSLNFRPNC